MSTKLIKIYSSILFFGLLKLFFSFNCLAQSCPQGLDFTFKTSGSGGGVNWLQFPEFSLPFKVVYGGTPFTANPNLILKRGYTHVSNPYELSKLPIKNRAYIYYGVAFPTPAQPWSEFKSPWGNDMEVYKKHWDASIDWISSNTGNRNELIETDIFVYDIERQLKSNDSILALRNLVSTPANIKNLNDNLFIEQYKKDLQKLYFAAADYTNKKLSPNVSFLSSYTDAPVLNTFTNLQGRTWSQWKNDKSAINFICYDFENNKPGGDFYKFQNIFTPSAYYYYDYPHPFASEYLSYLLFQCEVNRAYTDKELMLFIWLKYSYNPDFIFKSIRPWMAEASAIFPFFAGAKGIWLWEQTAIVETTDDLSHFEHFTKGLYRLSQFKDMFEGDYELIETISARDYNENKLPIWRGVLKGDKILVAAHNPYAKNDNEEVNVILNHKGWNKVIKLKGYEVFLCKFDYDVKTESVNEKEIKLLAFPNPFSDEIQLNFEFDFPTKYILKVFDQKGKLVYLENVENEMTFIDKKIKLQVAEAQNLLISIETPHQNFSKKVLVTP